MSNATEQTPAASVDRTWEELIDRDECARIWNVNGQRARVILQKINRTYGNDICKIIGTSWVIRRSDAERYRPARMGGPTPINLAQLDGTTIVE